MNKKAGLEMSMNSIVVIILAIVFISLVIVFIQSVFESSEGQVLGIISDFPNVNPPTRSEPFKIPTSDLIQISKGSNKQTILEAYYKHVEDKGNCSLTIVQESGKDYLNFTFIEDVKLLEFDQNVLIRVGAVANSNAAEGSHFAVAKMCCGSEDDTRDNLVNSTTKDCKDGIKQRSVYLPFNIVQ